MDLKALFARTRKKNMALELGNLCASARPWLISRLAAAVCQPVLYITTSPKRAEEIATDISFFTDMPVFTYQCHDSMPFTPIIPSSETMANRISILYQMATLESPHITIAPVQALPELTISRDTLIKSVEYLEEGEETDRDALISWLIKTGYERQVSVKLMGEFSVRGGILDIFPPSTRYPDQYPARIDFFGDMVEEISLFDPISQRSIEKIKTLTLLPAGEIVFDEDIMNAVQLEIMERAKRLGWSSSQLNETIQQLESKRLTEGILALIPLIYRPPSSIKDFLQKDGILVIEDPSALEQALDAFLKNAQSNYEIAMKSQKVLSEFNEIFIQKEAIASWIRDRTDIILRDIKIDTPSGVYAFEIPASKVESIAINAMRPNIPPIIMGGKRGEELLGPVFERLKNWVESGFSVIISTPGERQGEKLREIIGLYGWMEDLIPDSTKSAPLTKDPERPGLEIYSGALSSGFFISSPVQPFSSTPLVLVTEDELLGSRAASRRLTRKKRRTDIADAVFEELKPGDFVVHRDYGVGIYRGLIRLDAGGTPGGEYLHLEYKDQDRLYLPVDRLGLIQRYTGIEGREPSLARLGGAGWQLAIQKVKKAVYAVAHELVELYAERMVREGYAFSPPDAMFRQFEAAFPYEETDDQAASIEEIIKDLERPRPMDRLLCGDVGYGKTEVAMRAAFKVVCDNKQVAVLVPTTLLAEQHERTFRQRFSRFPVSIAALSRLKSRREQKETLKKAGDGTLDILIGTHRLLEADVRFKDLGLLIIDEEQRFGVRHKERLKRLKQSVDCLTMTATPIPRTLQLSLLGLRDISVIKTPPRERLPVKTFLAEFDDSLIKEAIEKEIARGGQIFFIHNRVRGIERIADHIRKLVTGIRVETAHGQMDAETLEDIMIRFVRGEIDCLVCTTIIESGIDIPSANTIIINRADTFGIADLYQLRGRVGRSNEQAYAYLLVPRIGDLTQEAQKRLKAVMEAATSGGGFRLAMEDMRIRGAGNILGLSQSGHIAEVGYELYLDLLQSAVEELKGLPPKANIDPEVNLKIAAFIPEDYCSDVEERLRLYRRLSRLENDSEAEEFLQELEDRFGPPPNEVLSLFEVMAIKRILKTINCIRIDRGGASNGDESLVLTFGPDGPPNPEILLKEVQKRKCCGILPDGRLTLKLKGIQGRPALISDMKTAVKRLAELITK
ncbi:MAG: transcription-repair coupling factor [Dissulfurimicrobium sp.]|uniref:transcription-repair coupling factor n=1 Tax=Dissulfurimicrobium sp. TaxID=2022436 RepID=UPI0040491EEC